MKPTDFKELQEKLDLNHPDLKALQLRKMKKQLIYCYDNSPYYKKKFDTAGVNPHHFTSLNELENYPTFDKYEERESQAISLKAVSYTHLTLPTTPYV